MSEHVEKWKKLGKVNYCEIGGFEAVGVKGQAPVAYAVPQHADLLAAAPELLAACEAIAALANGQGRLNLLEVAGQARAAIVKAAGRGRESSGY